MQRDAFHFLPFRAWDCGDVEAPVSSCGYCQLLVSWSRLWAHAASLPVRSRMTFLIITLSSAGPLLGASLLLDHLLTVYVCVFFAFRVSQIHILNQMFECVNILFIFPNYIGDVEKLVVLLAYSIMFVATGNTAKTDLNPTTLNLIGILRVACIFDLIWFHYSYFKCIFVARKSITFFRKIIKCKKTVLKWITNA